MAWNHDDDDLVQDSSASEEMLPGVHPDVAGLESLSPIAASFSNTKTPPNEVSLKLVATFQKGRAAGATSKQQAAAQEAITALNANLFRLVLTIAREQITRRYGVQKVSEMTPDLIQEGAVAIAEAAARFDVSSPGKANSWSAYAGRAVRDRIRTVVTKDETTTTPASWKRLRRIASTRMPEMREELGRAPSMAEVRADLLERCLDWAAGKLSPAEQALPHAQRHEVQMAKLRKQGTLAALDRLEDVLTSGMSATSMQAPAGENRTVGDTVANCAEVEDSWDAAELSDVRTRLAKALQGLDQRSRTILMYRFAFVDGTVWTHTALGQQLNLSAERVRQIEQEALLSLKAVSSDLGLTGLL